MEQGQEDRVELFSLSWIGKHWHSWSDPIWGRNIGQDYWEWDLHIKISVTPASTEIKLSSKASLCQSEQILKTESALDFIGET